MNDKEEAQVILKSNIETVLLEEIDYDRINAEITVHRKHSLAYLRNNVEKK